jgi:hypothetical protein
MRDNMTHNHISVLPVGHPARPTAAAGLRTSLAGVGAFTAFAYVTTHAGVVWADSSLWQSDPAFADRPELAALTGCGTAMAVALGVATTSSARGLRTAIARTRGGVDAH